MKIRIQDHSIRFRLTLREVEEFAASGRLERVTRVLGEHGPVAEFRYALERREDGAPSEVLLGASSITMRLGASDCADLIDPANEGAYVRREWRDPAGATHRFMAFVEKDRPGSTCVKPEAWIYDAPRGGPVQTRPIPPRQSNPSLSPRS